MQGNDAHVRAPIGSKDSTSWLLLLQTHIDATDVRELISTIDQFQNKELGKGVSADEIQRAEVDLGVTFPNSYREFLLRFGWARFAHDDLCGLGADLPDYRDVVKHTKFERMMNRGMPPALVTLMADGAGNHYCLDTRAITSGECGVVFWDHECMKSDPAAEAFVPWLRQRLSRLSMPPDMSWRE